MGVINIIDHGVKKMVYSIFWSFIDPLEPDRLYSQLVDVLERNLDAHDPERLMAPDHYQVFVNNTVFIKHAHAIKKLESVVRDRLQKYAADKDYELPQPKIDLQIISSATVPKKKADIVCWFSPPEEAERQTTKKYVILKVVAGEGTGLRWELRWGKVYQIGRISNCDICLPFANISKNQATLTVDASGQMILTDKGSTNGTFINDEKQPIRGSREIRLTDKIQFCKVNPIVLTFSTE